MARRAVDDLLTRARDLVLGGALDRAAPMYEKGARMLLSGGEAVEGVTVMVAAARLRAMLGQLDAAKALLDGVEDSARSHHKLGEVLRARAEIADQRGDVDGRAAAWRAAYDHASNDEQRLVALVRQSDVARASDDAAAVAEFLAQAVPLVPEDKAEGKADLLIEMAVALTALGRAAEAEDALVRAEAHISSDLTLRARVLGQRGVIALSAGHGDQALELAHKARDLAVAATHVPTYLSATMLVFMIHDTADRALEAYDTLMRARASLHDLHGEQGAGLVQPAIDTYTERLGQPAADELHERWVAWRRGIIDGAAAGTSAPPGDA